MGEGVSMRHLKSISSEKFYKEPMSFNKYSSKDLLKYAIGSNLYMNALMDIYSIIKLRKIKDITTITICFEDSIKERDVDKGEINVLTALDNLNKALEKREINEEYIPLIFIRVRSTYQFIKFSSKLSKEELKLISGFIFPKFSKKNGLLYLEHLKRINNEYDDILYGMPILESGEIIYKDYTIASGHTGEIANYDKSYTVDGFKGGDKAYYIKGNITAGANKNFTVITFNLYDKKNNLLGTAVAGLKEIKKGKTYEFKALSLIEQKDIGKIDHYKIKNIKQG